MSVYTKIKRELLISFLDDYSVGNLLSYEGIHNGIENTNYFVTTDQGRFVLTLFEKHKFDELPYFIDVMTFFYRNDIPVAQPITDTRGNYVNSLRDKPSILFLRLSGRSINAVTTLEQCSAIGDALGRMHSISRDFHLHRANERGLTWFYQIANVVSPLLDDHTANILKDELKLQAKCQNLSLPWGLTHSDLFRDNALFEGNELQGVIDFYYACDEYLLYDLAVMVNDWCVDETGLIEQTRYQALMAGYSRQRPLTENEQEKWNLVLRIAALRFLFSRLQDTFFPRYGTLTQIKDPNAFLKILLQHRDNPLYYII